MSKDTGEAAPSTLATDLRRLVILAFLTALAVLLCERWSEAGVVPSDDRPVAHVTRTP